MKTLFTISLFLLTSNCFGQNTSTGPWQAKQANERTSIKTNTFPSDKEWQAKAERYIAESEYFITKHKDDDLNYASNRAQRLAFAISPTGYKTLPIAFTQKRPATDHWEQELSFKSISRNKERLLPGGPYQLQKQKEELNYRYNGFSIQYINNEKGLRQNFIIDKKLPGTQQLELSLKYRGKLTPVLNNNGLSFTLDGAIKLFYTDLKVWDAKHTPMDASFELRDDNTIAIIVDDATAEYPITIDPLNKTPDWTGTATGILPTVVGPLAVEAAYGYTVAGVGDLNNDGFEDVVIGAPSMSDIIAGSGTLAAVGAIFVYHGSSSGLPIAPNNMLQPITAVVGSLFGYSITGGDINDDGNSDILVGAPKDNIIVGGQNGNVGKAFVFSGATLTPNTNVAAFITLELSGNSIIKEGINLSVNALFGFSSAVTEDLNGDGKNDMIIGAPTYAGIKNNILGDPAILDVQSGASFIFLTNAANDNTSIVKLEPITSDLLGLGLLSSNINGLLFGFAVDGLGDYNNDGNMDVVVTAPAGINLGSFGLPPADKVLQGSAIIYYGTGAGVSTSPGALLTATADGLLSDLTGSLGNAVNLFGTSVKGVRDAAGARNGNVLVGAPLGGTLVNVAGLNLKTGTVNVFLKKGASPSGNVVPDQALTSPRNDNTILGIVRSSLLFGFSLDNIRDVNCDNIADIIIGEPASSGTQLVNSSVSGGAAYIFLGKSNGAYHTVPYWTLTGVTDALLGINAISSIGYSVSGAGKVRGVANDNFIVVGAPSRTLDFGTGLLNLGSTFGTLFGLAAGDNGVGKAYLFDIDLCSITILPITLTELRAVYANGRSQLTWGTAQESNSSHFEIERSTNGINFDKLGDVAAAGYSSSEKNYSFNDLRPDEGINYYRLKMVDKDGRYVHSNVVSVNVPVKGNIITSIYPSPFVDKMTLSIESGIAANAKIELFDNAGKLVVSQLKTLTRGTNKILIEDLDMIGKGFYIIKVNIGDDIFTQKIIK